ncbi:MAG: M20 family metallopeptidase [Verrucomicrobiota bacterium]
MNPSIPGSVSEMLQELIRIPSVNPDGSPDAGPITGEKRCAEQVAAWLSEMGAAVVFEEVLPDRPNVLGRFPGPSGRPRIALAPHLDTVGVDHMTIDPFGGEIRNGRIFGRGASDTKGTMAAMLWALHGMGPDRLAELNTEVTFVGLMGEETNQPGSRDFAKKHEGAFDFALIGEPTELDIVYVHKGCAWVELETRGRAAHGSMPERGENAILKMSRFFEETLPVMTEDLRKYSDPVLGGSTVNLGICQGGSRANIVPDRCVATLDFRTTPALAERGLKAFLSDYLTEEHSYRLLHECLPLSNDPENPYIKKLESLGSRLTGAPWFCDAAMLAARGIPAVALGPGSIRQAHTNDEYLEVEALEKGAERYRAFLEAC